MRVMRLDAERYVPDAQTPEATEDTSLLEMVEISGPDSSVGRASETTLRGRGFKSLSGRGFRPTDQSYLPSQIFDNRL